MRGKSYNKAQKIGRYCIGCGRRCRKGGRGEFCSSRCKQKQYIKEVRQNYASRRWIKKRLMANSNKCGICKQRITVQEKATIDHIVPLVKGGRDEIDNMQLAHEMCNRIKGDELPPHVIYN